MNEVCQNKHLATCSVSVRRAGYEDVGELVNICRKSFPDSLKWRGLTSSAEKWWRIAIDLPCCETWVCLCDGKIEGYVLLISDINRYNQEKKKQRPSLGTMLLILMIYPRLLITKILKRVFSRNSTSIRQVITDDSKKSADELLWVELIAVSPNSRGKGLGAAMLKFCEQRAAELQRKAIKLNVNKKNIDPIRLYERSGFVKTVETRYEYIYTKPVAH